jgi:hypothetical protein
MATVCAAQELESGAHTGMHILWPLATSLTALLSGILATIPDVVTPLTYLWDRS